MYRNLTKLILAGGVAVALLALGGTLFNPFIGQALAQVTECSEGMTEIVLVLPNGMEKLVCVPVSALEGIENAEDNAPVDFSTEKTVFVTSTTQTGDLGGLAGADAICQSLAEGAMLEGTYKAWVADDLDSPATRFTKASVPYVRTDGIKIADDWADLTDGALHAPINVDETATLIAPSSTVWTRVSSDGTSSAFFQGLDCRDWTDGSGDSIPDGGGGMVGAADAFEDFVWTRAGSSTCSPLRPLYCFQQ